MAYFYKMARQIPLSLLVNLVQDTIDAGFYGQSFWITTEITDVKRQDAKNWCFCKCIEKKGNTLVAEMPAVFWQNGYQHIRRFEQVTQKAFKDGIQISCLVEVKFHARFGLKLEITEIDLNYSLGQLEMQRRAVLEKLATGFPGLIKREDDLFFTFNNQLPLPAVIQKIALITAPNSDGQRDFLNELTQNAYGYVFDVVSFLTTIQGDLAPELIVQQLEKITARSDEFDAVALVRGGGSQTDFSPFDAFEVAKTVALLRVPVLTGIGHDRNTSITDLMARQYKVPTKVAAAIVDHNFRFENDVLTLKDRLEDAAQSTLMEKNLQLQRWGEKLQRIVPQRLESRKIGLQKLRHLLIANSQLRLRSTSKELMMLNVRQANATQRYLLHSQKKLQQMKRLVEQFEPQTILNKGFTMLLQNGAIKTSIHQIDSNLPLTAEMKDGRLTSQILEKSPHEANTNI